MFRYLKISFLLAATLTSTTTLADPNRELRCLAQNAYHEARGEGDAGMKAVIDVTLNRVKSKKFPNTICGVVYQKNQFTWVKSPNPIIEEKMYRRAVKLSMLGLSGKFDGFTRNSLYYHEVNIMPRWASKLTKQTKIGNHIFYS